MKTKTIIIAISLFALVLLAIFLPLHMISPGDPIDAHAKFATDCYACHTPFIGSSPAKCIECHKVEEIGIKTTKGLSIAKEKKNVAFHQKLLEDDCVACHSDHKGVMAFRPISHFSHKLLDETLQKRCNDCHSNPGDALHLKVKGNCSMCHTQEEWLPATFEHEEYFRFDRDHDTDCATCHVNDLYDSYTCYGCHEHSRSEIREEHIEEGIRKYENCVECHRSSDEDEAEDIWRTMRNKQNNSDFMNYRRESDYKKYKERDDDD